MTVFQNKDGKGFYTVFDDELYSVYLENENQPIKLLTSKKGTKFFQADLIARRSGQGKYYFVAMDESKRK